VLAAENMNSVAGVGYWFKLLDYDHVGYLNEKTLNRVYQVTMAAFLLSFLYLYRTQHYQDVVKEMTEYGYSPPSTQNVVVSVPSIMYLSFIHQVCFAAKNEIFDMCRVQRDRCIYRKDLVECGVGGTVLSILIEVNGLWKYENTLNG
jgi:hypothetical protein